MYKAAAFPFVAKYAAQLSSRLGAQKGNSCVNVSMGAR